jgi:tetratricopeptide (TPR) repeat protein
LNNAIGWSYRLLSVEEQKLFSYLSVFSGGFTLEAAESIFSGMFTAKSVSDLITSLLDKSLLQRTLDREAHGGPLFNMLVTIQQFARDRLRDMGEETEVCKWHLTYFLSLAEKGDQEIRGPNQIEWLQRLGMMRDNFRAALQWAIETEQVEAALYLARKLSWLWFMEAEFNEGRQWLGRVLALPDAPLYPGAYAEALTQMAHHTWLQSGAEEARPFVEQALALARKHGDKRNIAKALAILGLVMNLEHNFIAAQVTLEESKILFREVHDDWNYAHAVIALALGPKMQDDRAAALSLHEQALALFRKIGDRYFQSVALRQMSDIHVKQGDWLLAQATLREALTLARELGSTWEVAAVLWSLTDAVQGARDYARAVRLNWAARNVFELVGTWKQQDESVFEEVLGSCRAALSEAAFAEAMEEGRAMTMEQAIAYALEKSDD